MVADRIQCTFVRPIFERLSEESTICMSSISLASCNLGWVTHLVKVHISHSRSFWWHGRRSSMFIVIFVLAKGRLSQPLASNRVHVSNFLGISFGLDDILPSVPGLPKPMVNVPIMPLSFSPWSAADFTLLSFLSLFHPWAWWASVQDEIPCRNISL
jgi:hypothetical protein